MGINYDTGEETLLRKTLRREIDPVVDLGELIEEYVAVPSYYLDFCKKPSNDNLKIRQRGFSGSVLNMPERVRRSF